MKIGYLFVIMALMMLAVACAPTLPQDTGASDDSEDKTNVEVTETTDSDDLAKALEEDVSADLDEDLAEELEKAEQDIPEEVIEELPESNEAKPLDFSNESSTAKESVPEQPVVTTAKLISGNVSKYYEWDKELFEQSLKDGMSIFLVFSTDSYPASVKQDKEIAAGFNELNIPRLIGFRLHFNDDLMTTEHEQMALDYGVGTIMTKAVIRKGSLVHKSTEQWDKEKFVRTVTQFG